MTVNHVSVSHNGLSYVCQYVGFVVQATAAWRCGKCGKGRIIPSVGYTCKVCSATVDNVISGCMRHMWTDDGEEDCPICMHEYEKRKHRTPKPTGETDE